MDKVFGLAGPEQEAIKAAEALHSFVTDNLTEWLSPEYFHCVQDRASVFLLHVDGWWEAYAGDTSILAPLRRLTDVHEIDSGKWTNYNWGL